MRLITSRYVLPFVSTMAPMFFLALILAGNSPTANAEPGGEDADCQSGIQNATAALAKLGPTVSGLPGNDCLSERFLIWTYQVRGNQALLPAAVKAIADACIKSDGEARAGIPEIGGQPVGTVVCDYQPTS